MCGEYEGINEGRQFCALKPSVRQAYFLSTQLGVFCDKILIIRKMFGENFSQKRFSKPLRKKEGLMWKNPNILFIERHSLLYFTSHCNKVYVLFGSVNYVTINYKNVTTLKSELPTFVL